MTEEIITFKKISSIWNDTICKNQNFFDNYFQSLTPEQRFLNMFSLSAFAREIIRSQFPKDMPEKELKKQMFIAYYKDDFSPEEFEKWMKIIF